MKETRTRIIQWTALLGCVFIASQIATILLKGEAFCLNQGCKIVENLTTVPPVYINLAGLLYFLAIFVAARRSIKKPGTGMDLLGLLLLVGLAIEGVLLSYQIFVAQAICSYCLIILALVVILNIFRGGIQLLTGLPVFLSVLAVAASLNFGASRILIQSQNLTAGTFAIRKAAYPNAELNLFFSSDCSHCQNVLNTIKEANNCTINFNPIDRIDSLELENLTRFPEYNPAVNRLLLSLLDIKTIPVLMTGTDKGPTLIKGEKAIVDYLNRTCSTSVPDPYSGASSYGEPDLGFSSDIPLEGECEIEVECPDDNTGQQSSPGGY